MYATVAAANECDELLLVDGSAAGLVCNDDVEDVLFDIFVVLSSELVVLAASDDIKPAAAAAADVRAATAATDAMTPSKLLTELFSKLLGAETGGFGLVPFILRSKSEVESGATCCR